MRSILILLGVLLGVWLFRYESLVGFCGMERIQAVETEEVLTIGEQMESTLLNILISALPAHERWMSALFRVQGEVLSAEGLVARNAMQRTSLAAFNTWSRNHWSGNGRRCHFVRFAMILVQFFLAKILG